MAASTNRLAVLKMFPWALGAGVFLVQVALGIVLFAVFQEYVPSELDTSDAWPGYLLAAYGGARFVFETPAGAINDRIERKLGLLVAFAVLLPATIAMSFARHEIAYIASAIGLGLGTAFFWPAVYAISADQYEPEQRGRVVGFLSLSQLLGFGLGGLGGALTVERWPEIVFACACAAIGAAVIAVARGVRRTSTTSLFARTFVPRQRIGEILTPQLMFLSALILLASTSVALVVPAIRPFGDEVFDQSFASLTLSLMPAILVGVLLYVPAGALSDRMGRVPPFFMGQVLMAGGLIFVAQLETLWLAVVATAVIVLGYVLSAPAWNAAIMDLAPPSHRGTVIGLSVALSGLGLAIGPVAGGIVTQYGSPAAALQVGGVLCLVTAAGVLTYGTAFKRHRYVLDPDAVATP